MKLFLLAGLISAIVLNGCARLEENLRPKGPVMPRVMSAYERAPICCTHFAEMEFEPLNVATRRNVDISGKRPAYLFVTGKSYFQAFTLPKHAERFTARVQSTLTTALVELYPSDYWHGMAYNPNNSMLLIPAVTMLDAEHQVTRTLTAAPEFESGARFIEVLVQPVASERYMIVHTDPVHFGRSMRYDYSIGMVRPLPFSPEGNIRLILEKRRR